MVSTDANKVNTIRIPFTTAKYSFQSSSRTSTNRMVSLIIILLRTFQNLNCFWVRIPMHILLHLVDQILEVVARSHDELPILLVSVKVSTVDHRNELHILALVACVWEYSTTFTSHHSEHPLPRGALWCSLFAFHFSAS